MYLKYPKSLWGSTPLCIIHHLKVLQKKAIRIISGVLPRTSTEPLHQLHNLLNLKKIYQARVLIYIYKYNNYMVTCIFHELYTCTRNVHVLMYHPRQSCSLHVPIVRTALISWSVMYIGVSLWN